MLMKLEEPPEDHSYPRPRAWVMTPMFVLGVAVFGLIVGLGLDDDHDQNQIGDYDVEERKGDVSKKRLVRGERKRDFRCLWMGRGPRPMTPTAP